MKLINVEVVFANQNKQCLIPLQLSDRSTIQNAIDLSGILKIFPSIDLTQQKVGIFGIKKNLNELVCEGDRIEIYRPLIIDPKEARKKRCK